MNIHLIPDETLDEELYTRVLNLLQAVPGVNHFYATGRGRLIISEAIKKEQEIPDKDSFEHQQVYYSMPVSQMIEHSESSKRAWSFPHTRKAMRWRDLFSHVEEFRKEYQVPEKEFAILLTPTANLKNWFALLDEEKPFNGFIHTDEWEHFIPCDPAFPIAFEVVALSLQKYIFESYTQIRERTHEQSIGCVSDLCMKKSEIILKMRTADVCADCMKQLEQSLSLPEIHHALAVMESLRMKMLFAQNFRQSSPPSKLLIRRNGRIYLPNYANMEIKIPTLEKALYILYLKHPEGIYISSLNEHRQELYDIYARLSNRGLMEDMRKRIDDMTNVLRDQTSVKISRIKKSFTDALGNALAEHYIIQGENAERKLIRLDRSLVENLVY
ncbi:MAG: hypothetical protein KGP35_09955 [Bacteroidetes bacterium]|nr:hypothetical protein [Bacteroidota bacterium]